MKKILLFSFAAMTMGGCDHSHTAAVSGKGTDWYGTQFDLASAATPVSQLATMVTGTDTLRNVVLEGDITATCGGEGCWYSIKGDNGQEFTIRTDHKFFVPTEGCEGKKSKTIGKAFMDMEDPENPELNFYATGVMIEGLEDPDMHEPHDHSKCDHDHSHDGEQSGEQHEH